MEIAFLCFFLFFPNLGRDFSAYSTLHGPAIKGLSLSKREDMNNERC